MVFDQIEQLKREYTDKYVVVDEGRPELARFGGQVGLVKTINMNGRALVEFQDYIANIGWFDIELDFLKVVPKPEAGAAAKVDKHAAGKPAAVAAVPAKAAPTKAVAAKAAPAAKPAAKPAEAPAAKSPAAPGEKKLSPIELARMQGAAKRKGGAPPAKAKPAAAEADKPATAPAAGKKQSTADILAAARTKRAAAPATEAVPAEEPAPAAATPEPSSVTREAAVVTAPAAAPAKSAAAASSGPFTKLGSTAEKIAWCRTNDAGRNTQ
jgi:hypothetical protein